VTVTLLEQLERDGYVVRERVFDPEPVRAALEPILAATPEGRNDFEGFSTRRGYGLLGKTRALDDLILDPVSLELAGAVLGDFLLSALVAIQIGPGESAQIAHTDDSIYPLPPGHATVILNTMWAVDDFTEANGATFLYPGSHLPSAQAAARAGHGERGDVVHAEMPAGSVMLYLGTLVHGGGANTTDRPRLGVLIEYLSSWLRQQETHIVVMPPDRAGELPPRLAELAGYSIRPPFMGYVDGLHPARFITR
jgi:ectoine hydroxylase-related dioxygenase (phytanoyl-CoA dioxygenase family)